MKYIFWFGTLLLSVIIIFLLCGYLDIKQSTEKCVSNKGEEITRHYLRELLKKPFGKAHPSWLVNPETGRRLELDCYNEELGIAAEYNGEHHYNFPNTFHKTREDFEAQLRRDKWKREKCIEKNILLIEIPYHIPKDQIREFLKTQLNIK